MSDYELQLKVKNAPFLKIIRDKGYATVGEFSRHCGINNTTLGYIANLKKPLLDVDGNINKTYQRVADFLNVSPFELLPEAHINKALERNEFVSVVKAEDMALLSGAVQDCPSKLLESNEADFDIDELMKRCTAREVRAIKLKYVDDLTPTEAGKIMGVSGDRFRQIEKKALRRLRHPNSGTKELRDNYYGSNSSGKE